MTISHLFNWKTVVGALCLAAVSAGCRTSPPPVWYVLGAAGGEASASPNDLQADSIPIYLTPIVLPSYLDRPQIVTRVADERIQINEMQRWGLPLDTAIAEVLGTTITRRLPHAYVDAIPARGKVEGYSIQVILIRLDGALGGPVQLVAQWELRQVSPQGDWSFRRQATYTAEATGKTYEAYVKAVGDAVRLMGEDMVDVLAGRLEGAP
ncbi:MAG: PqiC family protein [Verrucomicrobiota bacterium]|jgi:uncharacterized lipoprotein YmbA|nr:PqiC family protein [Verrucomicrobiota bacterium]